MYDIEHIICYILLIFLKMHTASHRRAKAGQRGSIEHTCDRGNCGRRFNSEHELKTHLKIHDNIVKRCHFCAWAGVQHKDYVTHLNTHFGIRPFFCSLCDAKFSGLSARKHHERSTHENIRRVYKCGSCGFNTVSYVNYKKHVETCDERLTQAI